MTCLSLMISYGKVTSLLSQEYQVEILVMKDFLVSLNSELSPMLQPPMLPTLYSSVSADTGVTGSIVGVDFGVVVGEVMSMSPGNSTLP